MQLAAVKTKGSNLDYTGDQIMLKLNQMEANFNLKFEEMKTEFKEATTPAKLQMKKKIVELTEKTDNLSFLSLRIKMIL